MDLVVALLLVSIARARRAGVAVASKVRRGSLPRARGVLPVLPPVLRHLTASAATGWACPRRATTSHGEMRPNRQKRAAVDPQTSHNHTLNGIEGGTGVGAGMQGRQPP